jgi:hypothetical protein
VFPGWTCNVIRYKIDATNVSQTRTIQLLSMQRYNRPSIIKLQNSFLRPPALLQSTEAKRRAPLYTVVYTKISCTPCSAFSHLSCTTQLFYEYVCCPSFMLMFLLFQKLTIIAPFWRHNSTTCLNVPHLCLQTGGPHSLPHPLHLHVH